MRGETAGLCGGRGQGGEGQGWPKRGSRIARRLFGCTAGDQRRRVAFGLGRSRAAGPVGRTVASRLLLAWRLVVTGGRWWRSSAGGGGCCCFGAGGGGSGPSLPQPQPLPSPPRAGEAACGRRNSDPSVPGHFPGSPRAGTAGVARGRWSEVLCRWLGVCICIRTVCAVPLWQSCARALCTGLGGPLLGTMPGGAPCASAAPAGRARLGVPGACQNTYPPIG